MCLYLYDLYLYWICTLQHCVEKNTFLNEFESQQAVLIPVSSKFIQTSGDSGSFTSANGSWNLILSEKGLIYFLVINIFGVILPGCVSVSDTYISHWTLTMCIQHKNTKHHSRFQLRLFIWNPFYSLLFCKNREAMISEAKTLCLPFCLILVWLEKAQTQNNIETLKKDWTEKMNR